MLSKSCDLNFYHFGSAKFPEYKRTIPSEKDLCGINSHNNKPVAQTKLSVNTYSKAHMRPLEQVECNKDKLCFTLRLPDGLASANQANPSDISMNG